jgi:hypothetical protein
VQEIHFSYLPYVFKPVQPTPVPTPTYPPGDIPEGMIYVDHRSVELFERIPDTYLAGARNLRMLFADRSVGQNINEALNCLTASSWVQALHHPAAEIMMLCREAPGCGRLSAGLIIRTT